MSIKDRKKYLQLAKKSLQGLMFLLLFFKVFLIFTLHYYRLYRNL